MLNPLLLTAFTAPAEALLNKILRQDPVTQKALQRFESKVLHVHCTSPVQWQIFVMPTEQGITLLSHYESTPDASISGSASALIQLALSEQQSQALFQGSIKMSGDTSFVQEFYEVWGNLEIDWEDHFSRFFGDIATHRASTVTDNAKHWTKQSLSSLGEDTKEYFQEEAGLLPTRNEVIHFSQDLDELRLNIDRIEARVARLNAKLALKT
ncbi:MAG: SCP2 sterol-binding domain-containing protein [Pseudohongiellaceae bacterium]|nr:SCP2 sterol-binding domain-containing protein [Pseudohongiellaceae bacterium]